MLKGVRIIDFSNYLPGPFASMRLAELGAEVIKVEAFDGDPGRHLDPLVDGSGAVFLANNRGKKSITLNLKNEEDREIALKLIDEADAVLESFRPGVMKKLGLDFETVSKINPGIVYCSLTGYGDSGSLRNLGSHDINYMAVSGALAQLKDAEGKPIHPTNTMADFMGGMAASERILAGIVSRGITGKGSYHCISIAEVMTALMGNHLLIEQELGTQSGISILNGEIISYAIYETRDKRYVTLAALEQKFWKNFCDTVEKEHWIEAHFSKTDDSNPVYGEIKELFKSRTLQEWTEFGQNTDCCLTPILEVNELQEFPLFMEKETVFHGTGDIVQLKMHADLKTAPASPPPRKGEQKEEILKSIFSAVEKRRAEG